jgi:hypothetical protein
MRQSTLFTKTLKNSPSDETSKNADLLIRAGYIHKEMAGVYDLLPLGMRVVEKIKKIIIELHSDTYYPDTNPTYSHRTERDVIRIQLDEYIDIDFIKQRLEHHTLSDNDIFAICEYLFNTVKQMQASVRDDDTDKIWKSMIDQFNQDNTKMSEFIPMFFRQLFEIIDKICTDILLLPYMLRTTINNSK